MWLTTYRGFRSCICLDISPALIAHLRRWPNGLWRALTQSSMQVTEFMFKAYSLIAFNDVLNVNNLSKFENIQKVVESMTNTIKRWNSAITFKSMSDACNSTLSYVSRKISSAKPGNTYIDLLFKLGKPLKKTFFFLKHYVVWNFQFLAMLCCRYKGRYVAEGHSSWR